MERDAKKSAPPADRDLDRDLVEWADQRLRAAASAIVRSHYNPAGVGSGTLFQEAVFAVWLQDRREGGLDRVELHRRARVAMRWVLKDRSREAMRQKRRPPGGLTPLESAEEVADPTALSERSIVFDLTLFRFSREEPELFDVVETKHLMGLSNEETAAMLGISLATVKRRWKVARLILASLLSADA